jgi:hypothetical protein
VQVFDQNLFECLLTVVWFDRVAHGLNPSGFVLSDMQLMRVPRMQMHE